MNWKLVTKQWSCHGLPPSARYMDTIGPEQGTTSEPIKAKNLVPQILQRMRFDYAWIRNYPGRTGL